MWRKIQKEDLKCGTVIRMNNIQKDGGYCMATIIAVHTNSPIWKFIKLARPYAYASEYNNNQPLLGAEIFSVGIKDILKENSDVEVFQGRDEVRSMVT